jgi:hypothetical protein
MEDLPVRGIVAGLGFRLLEVKVAVQTINGGGVGAGAPGIEE